MIKWYSFNNFQSYLDGTKVELSVPPRAPHSYFDYELEDGNKYTKVLSIFGANGSGKSNLIKPLAFIAWFISFSFERTESKDKIPYATHKFSDNNSSEIEVEFCIPKNQYGELNSSFEFEFRYKIHLNQKRVLKEELKVKTSRQYSRIFDREYDEDKAEYLVKSSKYIKVPDKVLKSSPQNCSLISYLERIHSNLEDRDSPYPYIHLISDYFSTTDSNLNASGRRSFSSRLNRATDVLNDNDELKDKVVKYLKAYDLGIKDILIKEIDVLDKENGMKKELTTFCIHEFGGEEFTLPMYSESSGTISAFCVLSSVIQKLDSGGISILDEFDNDFHPQLTMEIINLFKNTKSNPKNAQLLFTSHNAELLKELRKNQVYLTEKVDSISYAWRADEVEGLKDRDNLYAKYINGALGATPVLD